MILPGATLGVLGGGQLGRMFTAEARRMGYRVIVLDPDPDAPAGQLADHHITRSWTDPEALAELSGMCQAVTTEFENVPADVLRALAAHIPVRPRADAVATTQDRIAEKRFLNSIDVPTAAWAAFRKGDSPEDAWQATNAESAILKTARMGYDGKGQEIILGSSELPAALVRLGSVPCILERRVALEREISVMVARGADGRTITWPVAENVHRAGILHTSVVPAMIPDALAAEARSLAERIVTELDYVGVMGVECFIADGGQLLVNELAPRPHNSGHWTLDTAITSQFEQQVRALTGLPLGATETMAPVAMINLLGDLWRYGEPRWARALALDGVKLHLYGKKTPRVGRKMGHLTVTAATPAMALHRAEEAWRSLTSPS
ncbi:MAG: 5-(carboxyamino)imidazole ribonucleotide synthase [Gemmatimonadota bacterium]